eukprot:13127524-Alexandrium_andersonii.AAC.1
MRRSTHNADAPLRPLQRAPRPQLVLRGPLHRAQGRRRGCAEKGCSYKCFGGHACPSHPAHPPAPCAIDEH